MSYAIVFTGEIKPAFTPEQVIDNLCVLFKKDRSFIEKLFTGKRVVIKRNMDLEQANKYLLALSKAGAVCELANESQAEETSEKPATLNQGGILNTLSMAEPGSLLVEQKRVESVNIDTSSLSMSEAGVTIMEHAPVEAPKIKDLGAGLAPAGSKLNDDKHN